MENVAPAIPMVPPGKQNSSAKSKQRELNKSKWRRGRGEKRNNVKPQWDNTQNRERTTGRRGQIGFSFRFAVANANMSVAWYGRGHG